MGLPCARQAACAAAQTLHSESCLLACPDPTSLLLQAAEGKLGRAYEYHRAPAPFVQLELLRLLGMLGAGDRSTSENMYAVVAEVKRRAEPLGNNIGEGRARGGAEARRAADNVAVQLWQQAICSAAALPTPCRPLPPATAACPTCHDLPPAGNALVYECIRTLTTIQPTPVLVTGAVESVSRFLAARENNLKYAGIDALTRLVRIDPKHAQVGGWEAVLRCCVLWGQLMSSSS